MPQYIAVRGEPVEARLLLSMGLERLGLQSGGSENTRQSPDGSYFWREEVSSNSTYHNILFIHSMTAFILHSIRNVSCTSPGSSFKPCFHFVVCFLDVVSSSMQREPAGNLYHRGLIHSFPVDTLTYTIPASTDFSLGVFYTTTAHSTATAHSPPCRGDSYPG